VWVVGVVVVCCVGWLGLVVVGGCCGCGVVVVWWCGVGVGGGVLGACSPRKIFEFWSSEMASGKF